MKIAGTVAVTSVTAPVQLSTTSIGNQLITVMGSSANWRIAWNAAGATWPAAGGAGAFFTAGGANSSLTLVADPSELYVANASGTISFIASS